MGRDEKLFRYALLSVAYRAYGDVIVDRMLYQYTILFFVLEDAIAIFL